MIVLDSSAVIAILKREPGAERLREAALAADACGMSAANVLESGMVAFGLRGDAGANELDLLLLELGVEIMPFDAAQAAIARRAFRRFGKGRHPAGLNFGDCFAYALATHLDEPLLFTGEDFSRTDVQAAVGT